MVGEVLLGLFCLALGGLCLRPALRYCWIGHTRATRRSAKPDDKSDKPKMVIPIILGVLFLLIGKALLVMGLSAMF